MGRDYEGAKLLVLAAVGLALAAGHYVRVQTADRIAGADFVSGTTVVHPPCAAIEESIWAHEFDLSQLAQARGLRLTDGGLARGCGAAPGVTLYEGDPALLVGPTPYGWLIDIPGRGLAVIGLHKGAEFAAEGRCVPVDLLAVSGAVR